METVLLEDANGDFMMLLNGSEPGLARVWLDPCGDAEVPLDVAKLREWAAAFIAAAEHLESLPTGDAA